MDGLFSFYCSSDNAKGTAVFEGNKTGKVLIT